MKKTKNISLVSLSLLGLVSCQGTSSISPLGLEYDNGTYNIDTSISNKSSSAHYQIFVRSFCDSNNDGIGDFNGIASKADYLSSLGIGAVWLTPIHKSHSYHGYDIDDYYSVNPAFGTMEDFVNMVNVLKGKGIDVMLDMVFNHTSTYNQYFIDSYNDYRLGKTGENSKADWYLWNEEGGSSYYKKGSFYYYAHFGSNMPDLNFDCDAVLDEFNKIMAFWLGKGVKGFRLDAVRYYQEENVAKNIEALNKIADMARAIDPNCYFVGENWIGGSEYLSYYSSRIDSYFDFEQSIAYSNGTPFIPAVKGFASGDSLTSVLETKEKKIKEKNNKAYSSYFFANHDTDRISKSLTGENMKVGASLLYLLPGTPYCYYGEEIGLLGIKGNESTDAMRRLPMIWGEGHENEKADCPDGSISSIYSSFKQVEKGACDLEKEPMSLVNHYKKVISIRNKYPFIRDSILTSVKTKVSNLITYKLTSSDGKDSIIVIHNTSSEVMEADVSSFSSGEILDTINTSNLKPKIEATILKLAPYSSIVLKGR